MSYTHELEVALTMPRPITEIEREAIENAVEYFHGNLVEAAKALRISVRTIQRKRKVYRNDRARIRPR